MHRSRHANTAVPTALGMRGQDLDIKEGLRVASPGSLFTAMRKEAEQQVKGTTVCGTSVEMCDIQETAGD